MRQKRKTDSLIYSLPVCKIDQLRKVASLDSHTTGCTDHVSQRFRYVISEICAPHLPWMPHMQFLFVRPVFCLPLPPHATSR